MTKTIVVTGASSGFGALSARAFADAGYVVYARCATSMTTTQRCPLPEPDGRRQPATG
jgi:NADP-dependent 3-hydroxy acid dehydrogenase YdfG